jgi:hypothetical protein
MEMRGAPKFYRSSPGIRRSFCLCCGTPLSYEDERLPDEIYFTVGVFDKPEQFEPVLHGWTSRSLDWLHLDDELPRYKETSRPR